MNYVDKSDKLMHYGTPRHSGRYPWGSGERPFQGDGIQLSKRQEKKALANAKEIAKEYVDANIDEANRIKALGEKYVDAADAVRDNLKISLKNIKLDDSDKKWVDNYLANTDPFINFELTRYQDLWGVADDLVERKSMTPPVVKAVDNFYKIQEKYIDQVKKFEKASISDIGVDFDKLSLMKQNELLKPADEAMDTRYTSFLTRHFEDYWVTDLPERAAAEAIAQNWLIKTYNLKMDESSAWSDKEGEDFMYVDELLDRSDELMHYGTPRHSGRYPWGSGERPFQGDGISDKKKHRTEKAMGRYWNHDVFSTAMARTNRKINELESKTGKKVSDKEKRQFLVKEFRKIKARRRIIGLAGTAALATPLLLMSDNDEDNYMAALLDKADDLEHGGPGSGRFPWGSGERPFQHRTPAGFMLPAHTGSYHQGHQSTRSSSSSSSKSSSSSSSNTGASSQYDAYKAEEAQYKRNEERRKQQKHAAEMADRERKIRKEDAKEKTDKVKAEEKEREDLEDAYWKEVTNMTNQLSGIRTHAKNLKAASKPVKDVTKKMSDQQLKELTDRLKLENSYLRELNTRQGYNARPDKVENLLGLLNDVSSMGRSASKVYRTANKQRKYL